MKLGYVPGTMSSHFCCVSALQNSDAFSGANAGSGAKVVICWEKEGAKPVISPASSNLWDLECWWCVH